MFYESQLNSSLRTYAEINTSNLKHNLDLIKKANASDCEIIAVVKANAYGHGDIAVCNAIKDDISYFAVAEFNEAERLRKSNINVPIIILGMTPIDKAAKLVEYNVTQSIHSAKYASALNEELKKLNKHLKVHVKINTGMTRLGFDCDTDGDINDIVDSCKLSNLDAEGIFSHFAESDNPNSDYTDLQISRFDETIKKLEENNVLFKYKHISNSAGNLFCDNSRYNMVRVGIMLYGFFPSDEAEKSWNEKYPPLLPVMTFKARIFQIRTLKPGVPVGYGRNYVTPSNVKIAVISAGYADGIPRLISGRTCAIEGNCKIVGNVCMDMCFVDITNCKHVLKEGDFITLFGENSISAKQWANAAETITYEIFCSISDRVPRIVR